MKKFLSVILALTFCLAAFSATAPTASAKSETISESEAKELIVKAYEFSRDVRNNHARYIEFSDDKRIELELDNGRKVSYWIVNEEKLPGGSYEKMCDYTETIYTKDTAELSYAYPLTATIHPYETMWENLRPLFYRDEKSVLFANPGDVPSYTGAYLYPNVENVEIKIISGDSKTAKANITVYFAYIDGPRTDDFDIVECRFEKTANGWRIAESEYSLVLATEHAYLKDYRSKNPDAPNPSGGGILIPDVREILLPVIAELKKDIDKYYIGEFCEDSAVDKLVAGCKATVEKIGAEKVGDEYIVTVNGEQTIQFVYDPDDTRIKIVKSTDKEATALVYFEFIEGDKRVAKAVECKFSHYYSLWMLEDSQIIDLLTNPDEFVPSPATGDNAFNTIAVCLGGMAVVMSVISLIRKRREE
ncbi:MAG: hypothetical protein IJD70_03060 [Clostridia bacterium]|nr:hypothetical protein [Clostridia bacterium]